MEVVVTLRPRIQSSREVTGTHSCIWTMTWPNRGSRRFYLPIFQEEIPVPPALSYRQNSEPAAAKQSPHRAAAPDTSVESPKTRCSSSKSGPPQGAAPIPPPGYHVCQETLTSSGINPRPPTKVSSGPQFPEARPLALSRRRVGWGQTKESSWDRLHYGRHHSPHWLQHNGHIPQSDGFPK